MKLNIKGCVAALALTASALVPTTSAYAWGCIAVSAEGTYGYSYDFDTRSQAEKRALNECANRTTDDSYCEITECDEDD